MRRSVSSKKIAGHNEEFWPLGKKDSPSRLQALLQDTSDIVLASTTGLEYGSQQSEMAHKITMSKTLQPSTRGPIAAATKALPLNTNFKVKYANGKPHSSPVKIVKPLSAQGHKKQLAFREDW